MNDAWPIYEWLCAPEGLATKRQLLTAGLTRGRQPIAGEIRWSKRRSNGTFEHRVAYLFWIDLAVAKRPPTTAQLACLQRGMRTRSTCPHCHRVADYCIAFGACNNCHERSAA